jgi:hypothetical protein
MFTFIMIHKTYGKKEVTEMVDAIGKDFEKLSMHKSTKAPKANKLAPFSILLPKNAELNSGWLLHSCSISDSIYQPKLNDRTVSIATQLAKYLYTIPQELPEHSKIVLHD